MLLRLDGFMETIGAFMSYEKHVLYDLILVHPGHALRFMARHLEI